jgi:hypothetical protein
MARFELKPDFMLILNHGLTSTELEVTVTSFRRAKTGVLSTKITEINCKLEAAVVFDNIQTFLYINPITLELIQGIRKRKFNATRKAYGQNKSKSKRVMNGDPPIETAAKHKPVCLL